MMSHTTQKTSNCILEVTKCHRWAADEMGAKMGTCKCVKEIWSTVKVFNVREMRMNSTRIRHCGLKTPFSG